MSPPAAVSPAPIAGIPAPIVPEVSSIAVRDAGGELLRTVPINRAEALVFIGAGEWVGAGRRRYVRVHGDFVFAPGSRLHGRYGTRPMTADGTGTMAKGQRMGDTDSTLEHIPIRD